MVRATRSSVAKVEAPKAPAVAKQEPVQLSSPPATPVPRNARKRKTIKDEVVNENGASVEALPTPKGNKKAKKGVVNEEDINNLPHGLGTLPDLSVEEVGPNAAPVKKATKAKTAVKTTKSKKEGVDKLVAKAATTTNASPNKKGKPKNNAYGLTPGKTPYPNWPHPTAEECEEITRLLSKVHGKVEAPKTIPTPSLEVSGCGEVPSVLDALIRTRLSAATSGTNSSRAFAGLVAKFGVLKEGIGKGSVDWNKVRLSDTKEIFEAIKSGGLADVKSKDIKKILQMVWEENQERRKALQSSSKQAAGESNGYTKEMKNEVDKAQQDVVSLDHLHLLSNDDAFSRLTRYPGIGPKTASCVLLFCLQRPSFAVDTHVFRLCKWLGWVPPPGDPAGLAPGAKGPFTGPNRNSTYAHCEVRIPDEYKYPLHQLLIRHGKICPRCRAITGESSAGWDEGCAIDHLVTRSGGRKDIGSPMKVTNSKKSKGKKKAVSDDESEAAMGGISDAESSELSDLVSDEEIEVSEAQDTDSK
ncbi:DNA glycosylase [Phaeosphaeriaceae sp. PMI808]|nr:DNA glycosylase [Phaeosphaeriaceae sp. PMI808]